MCDKIDKLKVWMTMRSRSATSSKVMEIKNLKFRFVWPVKISQRQVSPGEATILHVSPKFATVYDHVSFQWTLKVHGSANVVSKSSQRSND